MVLLLQRLPPTRFGIVPRGWITLCPRAAGRGPRAWYSSVADMNFDTALYVCSMNSVSRTALYGLATLVLLFGIFVYPYSEYSYV